MVEGLFVPEKHRFVAGLDLVPVGDQRDQADGRRRSGRKLGLGLFADIGTGRQLGLLGRQFHRESQASGKTTFLAVGFGKQFIDIETGNSHGILL